MAGSPIGKGPIACLVPPELRHEDPSGRGGAGSWLLSEREGVWSPSTMVEMSNEIQQRDRYAYSGTFLHKHNLRKAKYLF